MPPAIITPRLPEGSGAIPPAVGGSIHGRFERIAAEHPDRTAAVEPDGRATYSELNGWANAVARALLDAGLRGEQPVAIAVPRSIAQVASVLGVLKAGGAYVPLVANQPAQRL